MSRNQEGCWHCGEPLPKERSAGARSRRCASPYACNGCRAVAEWIGELGLADYYRLRSEPVGTRARPSRLSTQSAAASAASGAFALRSAICCEEWQ